MNFIFLCSLLLVSLLQCLRVEGMAVDPQRRYQDGIAKETIKFLENNDAICKSHRNYRQAPVEATIPLQKNASRAEDELQIIIKHHDKTPTGEGNDKEETNPAFIKRSPSSTEENYQLSEVLEKKMNSLESKDNKHPKTRSYSERVLHHKENRYDHPSNGNLEVFLGGAISEDSEEHSEYIAPDWQHQGLSYRPSNEHQGSRPVYRQDPVKVRTNRPVSPVYRAKNHANRYKTREEYTEGHYENKEQSGYSEQGSESGEYVASRKSGSRDRAEESGSGGYVANRKSGSRDRAEERGSGEYVSGRKSGYRKSVQEGRVPERKSGYSTRDDGDEDEQRGYKARKKSGYARNEYSEAKSNGYETQDDSESKSYENKDGGRGYEAKKEEYNDEKQDGYSSEKTSGEDVLVKISVDNDKDSPNVGKVKIDVNKDKDLFPEERQLKISVKKDKDLPPAEEREIKIDIKTDCEQEDKSGEYKTVVEKEDCDSGDDRTIVQVKKPRRKCCKKRKNKSSRRRKY